jgi:hypothetical protein
MPFLVGSLVLLAGADARAADTVPCLTAISTESPATVSARPGTEPRLTGDTNLLLDGTDTDWPSATATVSLLVPKATPLATALLSDDEDPTYADALLCVDGWEYLKRDVALRASGVVVTLREKVFLTNEGSLEAGPWTIQAMDGAFTVRFDPRQHMAGVLWRTVQVGAQGFRLTAPSRIPTEGDHKHVIWSQVSAAGSSANVVRPPLTVRAVPSGEKWLELSVQSGDNWLLTWLPFDVEQVLAMALLGLLAFRAQRAHGMRTRLVTAVRAYSLMEALLLLLEALTDIPAGPDLTLARVGVVSGLALGVTLVTVGASSLWQWLAGYGMVGALFLLVPEVVPEDVVDLGALCLAWLLLVLAASELLTVPALRRPRIAGPLVVGASAVTGCMAVLQDEVPEAVIFLPENVLGFLLLIATARVLLQRSRLAVPALSWFDWSLMAWLVGWSLFKASWYSAVYFSLPALLGALLVLAMGAVTGQGRALPHRTPFAPWLASATHAELLQVRRDLLTAERQLTERRLELRHLAKRTSAQEGVDRSVLSERLRLAEEARQLRSFPPIPAPSAPAGRSVWRRVRTALGRARGAPDRPATRASLPSGVDPIDVSLALGPEITAEANGRRAGHLALLLGLVPSGYIAYRLVVPGESLALAVTTPWLPLFTVFAREAAMWWVAGVLLGVTWTAIAGRRGSSRALHVWAWFAIPLLATYWASRALEESPVDTALIEALSLMLLLVVGLLLDVRTVRRFDDGELKVNVLARYYRWNPLAGVRAFVTVVVPLLTAGVTLWQTVAAGLPAQGNGNRGTTSQQSGQGTGSGATSDSGATTSHG